MPSTVLTPLTPLLNPWTLWYSAGDKNLSWKENQVKISTVATVDILTWFSFHERFLSPAEYQRVQGLRSGVRGVRTVEGMDTVDRNGQMDIFLLSSSLLGGMVERVDRNLS